VNSALKLLAAVVAAVLLVVAIHHLTKEEVVAPDERLKPAFFIVQHADVRGEGVELSPYGMLVCNPALDPDAVRAAAPDAIVLGYVHARHVPYTYGTDESIFGQERAMYGDADYWPAADGGRLEIYPGSWEVRYTTPNAMRKIEHIATRYAGWDGVYIDELVGGDKLPAHVERKFAAAGHDVEAVTAQWLGYRSLLVQGLRQRVPEQPVIANVGFGPAALRGLGLTGLTVEDHWPENRSEFESQAAFYGRGWCVAWEWTPTSERIREGVIRSK